MKIISVASAKGGVGKSTFCACVGKMHALHDKRVLLVDMDIGVRSLDILLGVAEKTVFNWGDLIKGNCDFRQCIIEVSKNLYLLPAPIDFSESYTGENFSAAIEQYKKDFDYIILDAPAGIETGFMLSLKCAEECIVVSTPDPVSIRAASNAANLIRKNGVKELRLVLNRFNKKQHKFICVDDIIDSVGARFLGIVPESKDIALTAIGEELPYDSKGNMAYLRIAKRLMGENVPFKIKNI